MRTFSFTREIRFGDCDPSGIAYFPAYLNILNGVVEEFWATIGFPWVLLMRGRRIATPTVHLECDFSRPSLFGDLLTFELDIGRVGRTSLRFEHVVSGADGVRWKARQTLVATSITSHRSMPWPDDVREALVRHAREGDGAESAGTKGARTDSAGLAPRLTPSEP
jgi:4-hydroxybenzoyl-CoA thioesterase